MRTGWRRIEHPVRVALAAAAFLAIGGALFWRTSAGRRAAGSADDAFSVYLLGSSTAAGFPYAPRADFVKIAALLVDGGKVDGRPLRVVNLAGVGRTAGVVLRDARELCSQRPRPDRSLVVLYVAHNEFARLDRRHD